MQIFSLKAEAGSASKQCDSANFDEFCLTAIKYFLVTFMVDFLKNDDQNKGSLMFAKRRQAAGTTV
jgi:hypothetical protein